jgi:hypothetical protein
MPTETETFSRKARTDGQREPPVLIAGGVEKFPGVRDMVVEGALFVPGQACSPRGRSVRLMITWMN